MMRQPYLIICILLFFALQCLGQPFVEKSREMEFSGRMIVKPKKSLFDSPSRQRLLPYMIKYYIETDEYIVSVPNGMNENSYAEQLNLTNDYEYVHPDWLCFPVDIPNDNSFDQQWHHQNISSNAAWSIQTGDNMTIALVDTGIDLSHPDLINRISGYNSADHIAEIDGGLIEDIHGHGTHTSGDAAAIGNNSIGVVGIGWNFQIMMIRATNRTNGHAWLSDLLEGARWAVEHGAKVISCSYAGVEFSSVSATGYYINYMGGLFFYAAGNEAQFRADDIPYVIVVGATDQENHPAVFSAYGPGVDIYAPGVDILSTIRGGEYGIMSGTSMATPIAAGLACLIWSHNPLFSPDQVQTIVSGGATRIGDPFLYGDGLINCYRSMRLANGQPICFCDWNNSGEVTSEDLFSFLDDFFLDHADFNRDSSTNTQDFYDFISCFLTGCE